jgi:hypothetical protein
MAKCFRRRRCADASEGFDRGTRGTCWMGVGFIRGRSVRTERQRVPPTTAGYRYHNILISILDCGHSDYERDKNSRLTSG